MVQRSFHPRRGGLYDGTTQEFFRGALPGISRTIKCDSMACVCVKQIDTMAKIYRIRKLSERECFRLMAVTDADVDKIQHYPYVLGDDGQWHLPEGMDEKDAKKLKISGSQQYKLAGNSIVVSVLEAIFTQMFRKDQDVLF